MIYWTACGNINFLNDYRGARSLLEAVVDARQYVENELRGMGTISYYRTPDEIFSNKPFRRDYKTPLTRGQWEIEWN